MNALLTSALCEYRGEKFLSLFNAIMFFRPGGNAHVVYQSKFHYHSRNPFPWAPLGHTHTITQSLTFYGSSQ